jgi:hypothetical protein
VKAAEASRKYYRYFGAEMINKLVTTEKNDYIAHYNTLKAAYEVSVNNYNTAE